VQTLVLPKEKRKVRTEEGSQGGDKKDNQDHQSFMESHIKKNTVHRKERTGEEDRKTKKRGGEKKG
jgi:hypothetical protein